MKIILIEDEPDSLFGMTQAVQGITDYGFTLFSCASADEALPLIEEERPELVVTDIMLPGMTGLDLAERIVRPGYQPKIIVVSGYNDFEYARRSIRIGAVDYLLKPFRTDEFIDKVRKALARIEEEQAQFQELKTQMSFAEIGTRSMRDEFLVDLCLKPTALEEHLYQKLILWQLEWLANEPFAVFVMDTKGFPDGKLLGYPFTLQTFAIGNIVQEAMADYGPFIMFKDPKHRWILIVGIADSGLLPGLISEQVRRYHKIELAVGRSGQKLSFEDICSAYQEALSGFRVHSLSAQSESIAGVPPENEVSSPLWSPEPMFSFILHYDEDGMKTGIHHFLINLLRDVKTESREDLTRHILNYLSDIHIRLSKAVSLELEEIPIRVWERIDGCWTLEEYEEVLGSYMKSLAAQAAPRRSNALIERAIRLIQERFLDDDLTLTDLAEELSIHPVSLSQSFKKETGKTYMDYLTETRVDRAKQMLRDTSLKIYEIAEKVGYQDVQHFGTLFKKRTGLTPKEYRYGK
jgi:two-component system response regulator YesN